MSQRNHMFYPWEGQPSVFYIYSVPEVPLLHPCLALDLEHIGHGAGDTPPLHRMLLLKAISHAQSDMEKES